MDLGLRNFTFEVLSELKSEAYIAFWDLFVTDDSRRIVIDAFPYHMKLFGIEKYAYSKRGLFFFSD